MASRSAKSPRNRRAIEEFDDEGGLAALIGRHRLTIGGVTAFAVAFSYVTANAIWYQPHAHSSAFFATRPLNLPTSFAPPAAGQPAAVETVIRLERDGPVNEPAAEQAAAATVTELLRDSADSFVPEQRMASQPAQPGAATAGNPTVAEVQRILKGLNLYSGDVDGLTGPQTRTAIENYRRMVGLSPSAEIDEPLLTQLGARNNTVAGAPPLPIANPGTDLIETSSAAPRVDGMVMRIQAGLKAFGNDGIEVDGVVGSRTKSAIVEFQSLFGLPETGEPNEELLNKMREIGLTS